MENNNPSLGGIVSSDTDPAADLAPVGAQDPTKGVASGSASYGFKSKPAPASIEEAYGVENGLKK